MSLARSLHKLTLVHDYSPPTRLGDVKEAMIDYRSLLVGVSLQVALMHSNVDSIRTLAISLNALGAFAYSWSTKDSAFFTRLTSLEIVPMTNGEGSECDRTLVPLLQPFLARHTKITSFDCKLHTSGGPHLLNCPEFRGTRSLALVTPFTSLITTLLSENLFVALPLQKARIFLESRTAVVCFLHLFHDSLTDLTVFVVDDLPKMRKSMDTRIHDHITRALVYYSEHSSLLTNLTSLSLDGETYLRHFTPSTTELSKALLSLSSLLMAPLPDKKGSSPSLTWRLPTSLKTLCLNHASHDPAPRIVSSVLECLDLETVQVRTLATISTDCPHLQSFSYTRTDDDDEPLELVSESSITTTAATRMTSTSSTTTTLTSESKSTMWELTHLDVPSCYGCLQNDHADLMRFLLPRMPAIQRLNLCLKPDRNFSIRAGTLEQYRAQRAKLSVTHFLVDILKQTSHSLQSFEVFIDVAARPTVVLVDDEVDDGEAKDGDEQVGPTVPTTTSSGRGSAVVMMEKLELIRLSFAPFSHGRGEVVAAEVGFNVDLVIGRQFQFPVILFTVSLLVMKLLSIVRCCVH